MPNKAYEVAVALKYAKSKVQELVNSDLVIINDERITVTTKDYHSLEQIPGEIKITPYYDSTFACEASKVHEGVEYSYPLTPRQASELNLCCPLPGAIQEMAASA